MTQTLIHPKDLQQAFHIFLKDRSISFGQADVSTLFDAFMAFFEEIRVENCRVGGGEFSPLDYLHFEASSGVFYFERLLYVPVSMLEPGDEDDGSREKWGLVVSPAMAMFGSAPDFPNVNLWSMDFPDATTFTEAVRIHPAMKWGMSLGPVLNETSYEQAG
ncbi:hypothetical protein E7T06_14450 [Deinococcus sp. Arct2-2]|uniref:hypothetical protein n=1 Tax=Deinococcus sp. Arct2-2 TaxID=2568653 RepID=UPI0010A47B84|nr:hypothetical protein [Deinococcus sp. Arct2-2]THF68865.1 hypothetical protein E7T06_14450 [Deinococcus sp. Arct2-2]